MSIFSFQNLLSLTKSVYAQEYTSYRNVPALVDSIAQMFNILLFISGAVFIGFLILGAYKFLTAQGDPKGIAGAKQSITYAFIGFAIVIGVLLINNIVVSLMDVPPEYEGGGVFELLQQGIQGLIVWVDR